VQEGKASTCYLFPLWDDVVLDELVLVQKGKLACAYPRGKASTR
jgi:hypothetical protein